MDDDLKGVQPYPVELWPESRPVVGRSSSGEQLYSYQVAVVLGRGKLAKIEVALTKWEEYQVKLLGDQLRKEGACRGLNIRPAKFVSRLSEFQTKDPDVAVDRRGAGGPEGAEGREGKKGKEGKGAPPVGRELLGRELASFAKRKRRTTWRLIWCWSNPGPART